MDDLAAKLQEILSSKEGQDQLNNIASMLGGSSGNAPDLSSLLAGLNNNQNAQNVAQTNQASLPNIDINTIAMLQKAFSTLNVPDKNSDLLVTLKPHLSDKRQKKVDTAITMMRLFKMLPLLKESGILGSLFPNNKEKHSNQNE